VPWVVAGIAAALVLLFWPSDGKASTKPVPPSPKPVPDPITKPVIGPIGTAIHDPIVGIPANEPVSPIAPVPSTGDLADGDDGVVEPNGPTLQSEPVPLFWYRAKTGDNMSAIARRAYGDPKLWYLIRDDAANAHLHSTTTGYETARGGHGPDLAAYYGDELGGEWGAGHARPTMYIPEADRG
jgi:hypothetical protein